MEFCLDWQNKVKKKTKLESKHLMSPGGFNETYDQKISNSILLFKTN